MLLATLKFIKEASLSLFKLLILCTWVSSKQKICKIITLIPEQQTLPGMQCLGSYPILTCFSIHLTAQETLKKGCKMENQEVFSGHLWAEASIPKISHDFFQRCPSVATTTQLELWHLLPPLQFLNSVTPSFRAFIFTISPCNNHHHHPSS